MHDNVECFAGIDWGRRDAHHSLYWRSQAQLPTGLPSRPPAGAQVPGRYSRHRA